MIDPNTRIEFRQREIDVSCAEIEIAQQLLPLSNSKRWNSAQELLENARSQLLVFRDVAHHFDPVQQVWQMHRCETYTGNLYLNGSFATGLPKHSDPYDIIVVQLAGEKFWKLFLPCGTVQENVLRAGDVLFIPRGVQHIAHPLQNERISIHASLHAIDEEPSPNRSYHPWKTQNQCFIPVQWPQAEPNSLRAIIETRIVNICQNRPQTSVYLRGSMLSEDTPHSKADIDLIVIGKMDLQEEIRAALSDLNRTVDIGYFRATAHLPPLLYVLLAIQSHCIVGPILSFSSIPATRLTAREIWSAHQLQTLPEELPLHPLKRVQVIKQLIRAAGVIRLAQTGHFSRDLRYCIQCGRDIDPELGRQLQLLYGELETSSFYSLKVILQQFLQYAKQEELY